MRDNFLKEGQSKIKYGFLKLGLKKKMVIMVMVCFFLTVFCCFGIARLLTEGYAKQQSKINVESITKEKREQIIEYFNNLDQVAYNICYSNWMQEVFRNGVTATQRQELENNAKEFLRTLSALYGGNQFAILAYNGTKLNSSEAYKIDYSVDLTQKEWYGQFLEDRKMAEVGRGNGIYKENEEWSITLYYAVNDNNTLDIVGIMAITIPLENIRKLLESRMEGVSFCLLDETGEIIQYNWLRRGPDEREIFEKKEDRAVEHSGEYISYRCALDREEFSWMLAGILDEKALRVEVGPLTAGLYSMIALIAVLLVTMTAAISRYITTPILKCRNAMTEIKHNNLGITLKNEYQDEIGELLDGFNEMSVSIGELIEKNKMMVALQKESEYKMLERQIRPHFLFNTLELINGLILNRKNNAAMTVCGSLGQLYRYHLNQDKWIKIEEEVDYIRQYLLIMKYKLEDLDFYSYIDKNLSGALILKNVLQPLVENSVKHGFERKRSECCISITVSKDGDRIKITIVDNGTGITEAKLRQLNKEIAEIYSSGNTQHPETAHIGIKNVVQRLYLEYGEAVKIQIVSLEERGTRIELTIPGKYI